MRWKVTHGFPQEILSELIPFCIPLAERYPLVDLAETQHYATLHADKTKLGITTNANEDGNIMQEESKGYEDHNYKQLEEMGINWS